MRLEHLFPDFLTSSPEEREFMFDEYSQRRQVDLETIVIKVKTKGTKSKRKKEKTVPVSTESLELLKKLGLIS